MSGLTQSPWPCVRLGDIGKSLIGLTYSPRNVKRSGTLVLRSSNIQDGSLAFDDNVYVDCAIPEKIRVRENDILICVRNGSRRLIGKSVILDRRVVGETFGAFMAVYRSDSNRFLQYFFQSDEFKRQIDEHLGATINQITNGSLNSFVVALPPRPEQEALAGRLQDADRLIETLQRLIDKKQAIMHGMMQQLFAVPADDNQRVALGTIAHMLSGGTPDRSNNEYWSGTIPWISASTLKSLEVATSDQAVTAKAVRAGSKMAPVHSTLVLVRGSALHSEIRASLVTADVCFNQDVKALVPGGRVEPKFLTYSIHANASRLLRLVTSAGNTAGVLDTKVLKGFEVWLPSKERQRSVISIFDDVTAEIRALNVRLAKARAVKAGMMQQLLTGRIRLPVEIGS